MKRKYIGASAYDFNQYHIFAGRNDEIKEVSFLLKYNKILTIQGEKLSGKTSFLKAGLTHQLEEENFEVFYFDLCQTNDIMATVIDTLKKKSPKSAYIDKIARDDNSLWFNLKKFLSKQNKKLVFIFDNSEKLILQNYYKSEKLLSQLAEVLYKQIPEQQQEIINKRLAENTTILNNDGFAKLYSDIDLKIVFSTDKKFTDKLLLFKNYLPDINTKIYELPTISIEKLGEIVKFLNSAKDINNFVISDIFLKDIITYVKYNDTVNLVDFQIVMSVAETIMIDSPDTKISIKSIENKLITEIIGEGRGSPGTIAELLNNKESSLLKKLSDNGIVRKYIDFNQEYRIVSNKLTEILAREQLASRKNKLSGTKKNILSLVLILALFVFSLIFGIYATIKEKRSREHAKNSYSTMLAVYAFQELEKNPTLSLRIAQKSFLADTNNPLAYSALINSFYKTNIFYDIMRFLPHNSYNLQFTKNGKYTVFYNKKSDNKSFETVICNTISGDTVFRWQTNSEITSVTVSDDEKYVLIASANGKTQLYNFHTEQLIHSFGGHKGKVWTCAFSHRGDKIITAGQDSKAIVWDTTGKRLYTLNVENFDIYCAKFSPGDSLIATSGYDNTIRIWDTLGNTVNVISINENPSIVYSIIPQFEFSPDSKYIVAVTNDIYYRNNKARLWDIDGNLITEFAGHKEWITYAGFSSHGNYIITCSRDKSIRLWDKNGITIKSLIGHEAPVFNAVFNEDDNQIFSVSADFTLRSWFFRKDISYFDTLKNITFADFSPSGINFMVAIDTNVYIYDLLGEILYVIDSHKQAVNSCFYSPDESYIITASDDSTAGIYSKTGKLVMLLKVKDKVNSAVISTLGEAALACDNGQVCVFDIKTGKIILNIKKHKSSVNSVCFASGGKFLVSAANDSSAVITNIKNGETIVLRHTDKVNSACFSPDGTQVLTADNSGKTILWDLNGTKIREFKGFGKPVRSAAFSPNGKYILTAGDDGITTIFNSDGLKILEIKNGGTIYQAGFSPNGKYIFTIHNTDDARRQVKLRLIDGNEIIKFIDEIDQYGKVWQLDAETMKKYGIKQ